MTFKPPEPKKPQNPPDSLFTFTGSRGAYRLRCAQHGNGMACFLGMNAPREWVVWDIANPFDSSLSLLDVEWLGEDRDGSFKIEGHNGQYVKWAVSGFTSSGADEATEFILREV